MSVSEPSHPPAACPVPVVENDDRGWLGREPTSDEQELVAWMKGHGVPGRILHVGIGTALLSREFGTRVVQGLTRDGAEAENARGLGLDVILCNKYDVASYADALNSPFDCIVDVNIRSYACCDVHFREYMLQMLDSLAVEGRLLTSTRGLDYLVSTPIHELRRLCPEFTIRKWGNVVSMRPGIRHRFAKWRIKRAAVASAGASITE